MDDQWPNLFVPGAGKSGTTSLHFYLNQHPEIWMSPDKETGYFSSDERYGIGEAYYLSLFSKGKNCIYKGESSTAYMMSRKVVERIKKTNVSPKFIFILRNPIDRVISHYNWLVGTGFEKRPFDEAFLSNKDQEPNSDNSLPFYYHQSCYSRWLKIYSETFKKENIHIVITEDLKTDPFPTVNSCFLFLKVPPLTTIQEINLNKTVMLKNPAIYKKTMRMISKESDNRAKNIYRKVFPASLRIIIRKMIVKSLDFLKDEVLADQPVDKFSIDKRKWIASFYREDVKNLKTFTGKEFHQWKDFV